MLSMVHVDEAVKFLCIHASNTKSTPQVMNMALFYLRMLVAQTRDACTLDKFSNFFFKFPTIQGQPICHKFVSTQWYNCIHSMH